MEKIIPIVKTTVGHTQMSGQGQNPIITSNASSNIKPTTKVSNQKLEIALLVSVKEQISKGINVYPHLSKLLSSNIQKDSLFWSRIGFREKILIEKGQDLARTIIDVFKNKKSPTPEQQEKMSNIIKYAYIISDHVPVQIKQRVLNSLPQDKRELLEVFVVPEKKSFLDLFRGKDKKDDSKDKTEDKEVITGEMALNSAIEEFDKTKYETSYTNLKIYIGKKLREGIIQYYEEHKDEINKLLKKLPLLKHNPFGGNKFARGAYNNKKINIDGRQFNIYHAGLTSSPLRINYIIKEEEIHVFELVSHTGTKTFKTIVSKWKNDNKKPSPNKKYSTTVRRS